MGVTIGQLEEFNMAPKRVATFKGISILRLCDNKMNLYLVLKGHRSKLTHQKEIKHISCVVLQKQIKKRKDDIQDGGQNSKNGICVFLQLI